MNGIKVFALLTFTTLSLSGCSVCIDWESNGNCPPIGDDEAGEGPNIIEDEPLLCSEYSSSCLLTQIAAKATALFYHDTKISECGILTSKWPCHDFVTAVLPLTGAEINPDAFDHLCGTCSGVGATEASGVYDPEFWSDAVETTQLGGQNYTCFDQNAPWADLGYGYAKIYKPNPLNNSVHGDWGVGDGECEGEPMDTAHMWCGDADMRCTGICDRDRDCEWMNARMPGILGAGEAQCAGWPMQAAFDFQSGQVNEVPHGCIWNTDSNGGEIPPMPSLGGLELAENLACDEGLCEVSTALLDALPLHLVEAAIGVDWVLDHAAGTVTITAVESYSQAAVVGLHQGDVITSIGVTMPGSAMDPDALLNAVADLYDGATQVEIMRDGETVWLDIVLAD